MTAPDDGVRKGVPAQALYISLGALVVPAGAALLVPDILGEQSVLIWLLALTPAFLLAYYKGWRGAALALAAGMATLSITQVIALLIGLTIPDGLFGVVVAYIADGAPIVDEVKDAPGAARYVETDKHVGTK